MTDDPNAIWNRFGNALKTSRLAQSAEIVAVFGVAVAIIALLKPFAGDNPIMLQAVVWVANIFMLLVVWLGLRLRDQRTDHFGLSIGRPSSATVKRVLLQSLVVFVVAIVGFILGAIVMANIVGIPEDADMSSYNYLSGNLPMLVLALVGVYIVSSFGEEMVYRGFLINRVAEMGIGGTHAVKVAVIVSSLLFGLAHYDWGVMGIGQTTFMGLALALAYLKVKRNLWVTIIAHGYMDTILMVQQYLADA